VAAFVYSASFASHFYYILCFMHFPRDEFSRVLGQIINRRGGQQRASVAASNRRRAAAAVAAAAAAAVRGVVLKKKRGDA